MKLTDRETTTVLAALRMAQDAGEGNLERLFPMYFVGVQPLSVDEIDELCERLNTEDEN